VSSPFNATGEATRSCHFISLTSDEPGTPRNEHLIKDRQTPCHIATLDSYQPNRRILHCLTRISEKIHYAYTISSRYSTSCGAAWADSHSPHLTKEFLVSWFVSELLGR
jgi:hypothetical protein